MKYYLAYGSNLSVEQMSRRCPDAVYVGTAEIQGYRLLFKGSKTGSYLTVEKKKGRKVPALVWRISDSDEYALDLYEGYPRFYQKEMMRVEVKDLMGGAAIGTVEALIYRMDESRLTGRPTESYYRICAEGYERFGFDEGILKKAFQESAGKKALHPAGRDNMGGIR